MSITASTAVWASSKAKGSARLVLLCLAEHANKADLAWPSIPLISGETLVSERQVSRCISQLAEMGEIQIIEKGGGRGNRSVYRITIDVKGDTLSGFEGSIKGDISSTKDDTLSGFEGSIKGDISSIKGDTLSERVTFHPIKGDTMSSEPPLEPPLEPSREPEEEEKRGEEPIPEPNPFPFQSLPDGARTDKTPAELRIDAILVVCDFERSIPRHLRRAENAAAQLDHYEPDYILERYSQDGWWFSQDWRGQKGSPPTPEQVIDTIGIVSRLSRNGRHPPASESSLTDLVAQAINEYTDTEDQT